MNQLFFIKKKWTIIMLLRLKLKLDLHFANFDQKIYWDAHCVSADGAASSSITT